MGLLEGFIYGMAGGAVAEFLVWWNLRHLAQLPDWIKRPFYWLMTGGMVVVGGGIVALYLTFDLSLTRILAVNVGASAPLIIGSLVRQTPEVPLKVIWRTGGIGVNRMKTREALSVVHHRILVLAGLGVVDYVALPPLPQE